MKLYTTELIGITTVSENIIALDKLRTRYGEPKRDERGSYWEVDEPGVWECLPHGSYPQAVWSMPGDQESV